MFTVGEHITNRKSRQPIITHILSFIIGRFDGIISVPEKQYDLSVILSKTIFR